MSFKDLLNYVAPICCYSKLDDAVALKYALFSRYHGIKYTKRAKY